MSAASAISPGAPAEVELDLPGEEPVRVEAEVVRVEHAPRVGMALRFIGCIDRARRPLANFIMRQHAHAR